MLKTCNKCGKEFNAERGTAKYCSPKCRMAHSRVSVTDKEVSVTNELSVTEPNVTVKEDDETRQWLIQQFKDDDKTESEIKSIMKAQDNYYHIQGHYFIPARFYQQYRQL